MARIIKSEKDGFGRPYIIFGVFWYLYHENRPCTAKELAEHFEISTRSVYRYIESICYAGIPIETRKGIRGGFVLSEDFVLENLKRFDRVQKKKQ